MTKSRRIAFGTFGNAAMTHRAGVLGWTEAMPPLAKQPSSISFAGDSATCRSI